MANFIQSLNKSIHVQSRHSASTSKFDKTRTAIVKRRGTSPRKYDIVIDGREYKNIPVYGNSTLSRGDVCKVTIPNNEMSQMYIHSNSAHLIGDVIFNIDNRNPGDVYGGIWESLGTLRVGLTNIIYGWQKVQ